MHKMETYKNFKPTISLTSDTVGIASQIRCRCNQCHHQWETNRDKIVVKAGNEKKLLGNSAYALNVQFCLALQQTGGARVEADIIASSLDLPHGFTLRGSTMKKLKTKLEF